MEQEENKVTEEQKDVLCKTLEETEKAIKSIVESGLEKEDVQILEQLIDIHKDIENEKYWKIKEKNYMYGNYDNYGNDSSYGRRGVPGTGRGRRYRGHDMLDAMYDNYEGYNEGREEYNTSGNYGAKDESIESLDKMLKSIVYFMQCLKDDADSQEEIQLVEKYARKISEM